MHRTMSLQSPPPAQRRAGRADRIAAWLVWLALTAVLGGLMTWPAPADAQGRVIPRACVRPVPQPCPPNAECAGALVPCQVRPIERISSDVQAHLEGGGRVVRYEITEKFVNRGGGLGEADYIFPLPNGAAFEDLRLEINGELVSGEAMNADKARQIYEDIVRRQRDPALVEWMGYGLLRARIFPLPHGEEKKVVVRFRSVVRREGSALRIDYARGTDPSGQRMPVVTPVAERDDDEQTSDWSRFTLTIPRGADYGEPYSPTHTLRLRDRGDRREVRTSGSAATVTILLPLRRPNEPSITLVPYAPDRDHGYALIAISPPASRRRPLPRDLTFVIDVSGSMRGQKMEQAKAAGRVILQALERGDRFRIIDFSTDVHSFRDGFVAATPDNVREAGRYIDNLRAEGSTNISGALEEALDIDVTPTRTGRLERMSFVVFVTDGEPTVGERNPDAIAAMAARLRNDARVFTFGVGAEIHAGLIEQLALEGRGTAHFVSANESVERAVSLLSQRLTSPVLSDVRVRAEGVRLTNLHPVLPLDLFAGQDLVLLARYEGSGQARIRVETDSPDGRLSWTRDVRFPARERDNAFVGRLWAAQRLGWLAAEKRKRGGSTELDAEIRSLGEKFGIPTEFSSYLVVEPGMTVAAGMRRDAIGALPPANAAGASRANEERARRLGESPVQLSQVVVTGTDAAVTNRKEQEFAAAKQAASQREAKSLADVDASAQVPSELQKSMRQVEQRTFQLVNGVWIDVRQTPTMRTVQVKPFSPLYFQLVQELKDLGPALALGERVIVTGRAVAIEFIATGQERMSERELRGVVAAW
ncbi:MAG: VIT domain-containing protein [Gemmatimonadaceae bacterium]